MHCIYIIENKSESRIMGIVSIYISHADNEPEFSSNRRVIFVYFSVF